MKINKIILSLLLLCICLSSCSSTTTLPPTPASTAVIPTEVLANYDVGKNGWPVIDERDLMIWDSLNPPRETCVDSTMAYFIPGDNRAVVNGQDYELVAAPISCGTDDFLVSADDIISIFGAQITFDETTGIIRLYWKNFVGEATQDGVDWGPTIMWLNQEKIAYYPRTNTNVVTPSSHPDIGWSGASPQLIDDRLFIPASYIPVQTIWTKDSALLVALVDEIGLGGIKVGSPYKDIPDSIRGLLHVKLRLGLYNIYGNSDIEVRTKYNLNTGVEYVSRIELFTDQYATPRQIRLGESIEKVREVYMNYGDEDGIFKIRWGSISSVLYIETESGYVTGLYCTFDAPHG